jgi:hypothetical protein
VSFDHLLAIIKFIYTGETEVNEEDLEVFMNIGRKLQIEGMTGENKKDDVGHIKNLEEEEMKHYKPGDIFTDKEQIIVELEQPIIKMENEINGHNSEGLDVMRPLVVNNESLWKLPLPPTNEDGKYPCGQCNYKTENSFNFRKHRVNIHLGVRYPCNMCNKAYSDSSALSKHKRVSHEGFQFVCNLCEYKTPRKLDLNVHKKLKHSLEIYT